MPGRGRGLRRLHQRNQTITNTGAGMVSNVDSAATEQVVSLFLLIQTLATVLITSSESNFIIDYEIFIPSALYIENF